MITRARPSHWLAANEQWKEQFLIAFCPCGADGRGPTLLLLPEGEQKGRDDPCRGRHRFPKGLPYGSLGLGTCDHYLTLCDSESRLRRSPHHPEGFAPFVGWVSQEFAGWVPAITLTAGRIPVGPLRPRRASLGFAAEICCMWPLGPHQRLL